MRAPRALAAGDVAAALDAHDVVDHPALPGRRNHLPAGVMIPLVFGPRAEVLLTRRATSLSLHAGEVCFPGGRPDPGDADLAATARREAREELGIEGARLLGRLSSMPVYTSDYRLFPVVADITGATLRPEPAEVAEVIRLDLRELVQPGAIEGIPYTFDGVDGVSPLFRVPTGLVFGATAHSLLELLQVIAPTVSGAPLPPPRVSRLGWADVQAEARRAAGG